MFGCTRKVVVEKSELKLQYFKGYRLVTSTYPVMPFSAQVILSTLIITYEHGLWTLCGR